MLFRTTFLSAVALLGASQAVGAALEPRSVQIATDPHSACNCPNNCSHKLGSSCKYYPNESSEVIKGECNNDKNGKLTCVGGL